MNILINKVDLNDVILVQGYFENTLNDDLISKYNLRKASILHFDCDLYSSTKTILDHIGNRIGKNTILIFDEYFNYPNWKQHEYRAFQEFVKKRKISYEYLAFTSKAAVCLRIN